MHHLVSERYNPDCIKLPGIQLVNWSDGLGCISHAGDTHLEMINGTVNATEYKQFFKDFCNVPSVTSLVLPMFHISA